MTLKILQLKIFVLLTLFLKTEETVRSNYLSKINYLTHTKIKFIFYFHMIRTDDLYIEEPRLHGVHFSLPFAEVIDGKVEGSLGHEMRMSAIELLTT